jgi:hypothetical protein
MKSKIRYPVTTTLFLCIFALTSFPFADLSFADRKKKDDRHRVDRRGRGEHDRNRDRSRIKRRVISPRITRHDHVITRLPRGYRRIWHDRKPYYYYSGVFYRPHISGFIAVGAPIGAIVVSLPVGYQRIWVDDSWYYVYGSSFYRRVPAGYMVVEAPPAVVVEDIVPELVPPPETAAGNVAVTTSVLNVRSGPGLGYPLIYQIQEGYLLEVHGKTTGWLYVQLPNGEFGWVMNIYTTPLAPGSG